MIWFEYSASVCIKYRFILCINIMHLCIYIMCLHIYIQIRAWKNIVSLTAVLASAVAAHGSFIEFARSYWDNFWRAFTRIHSSWIKSSGKYKGRTNFKLCAWKYLSSLSILACDGFLRDFFQLRVKSCQSCCQIKVDLTFFLSSK